MYLTYLRTELGIKRVGEGVLLSCDNQSSMKIAQNHVFHKRSEHIRYHFIQEKVESGEVVLHFIGTKLMAADQLTKHMRVQVLVGRR